MGMLCDKMGFHRITEWPRLKGASGVVWSSLPVQAGPPRASFPDQAQAAFEYLWGGRLRFPSGHPVPVLSYSHSKSCPYIQMELPLFQFLPFASCPVTGHHWKHPDSIFLAPSLQVFLCIGKFPLSLHFSRLNSLLNVPKNRESATFLGSLCRWTGGIKEGPHCLNQAFLFLVILPKHSKFQEKAL